MKYNLHTHSFYCGHGKGLIGEYVSYAKEKEFSTLGFTEHCPFLDETYHRTRMPYSQMKSYESDIEKEKCDEIDLLIGYECDYIPSWHGYFEDLRERVDYLISGTHFIHRENGDITSPFSMDFKTKDLIKYCDMYIKAMNSGLFLFLAHPDVFLLNYPWNDNAKSASLDIIQASISLGIPLEVNANGIEKSIGDSWGYPNINFWSLAKEYGVNAVISSDAHSVENLDKHYDDVYEFAKELGINILVPVIEKEGVVLRNQE